MPDPRILQCLLQFLLGDSRPVAVPRKRFQVPGNMQPGAAAGEELVETVLVRKVFQVWLKPCEVAERG